MEHLYGNQYKTQLGDHYDIECLIMLVDLSEFCNKEFGTDFKPSERVLEIVGKLRGKKVYGNINYPDRFYVKKRKYSDDYEVLSQYHYKDVSPCFATYGELKKDGIIRIVEDLSEYVEKTDLFNKSFLTLMGYWDMKYICNAEDVARHIIAYYGDYVTNFCDGLSVFFEVTGTDKISLN